MPPRLPPHLRPPSAPPQPPTLDWNDLLLTLIFMTLGIYLAFFFQRTMNRKIEDQEMPEEVSNGVRAMQAVGFILFLYSLGELGWRLYQWIRALQQHP